jgi:hypothetical protein
VQELPLIHDEEDLVVAHIYAYFDESGKKDDHRVVVFAGFAAPAQTVHEFQNRWNGLLREYGIEEFTAKKMLRYSEPCGKMTRFDPEARGREVTRFIREITEGLELGILSAVDVNAFDSLLDFHPHFGGDPHYLAFYAVIMQMLQHYVIPRKLNIGLICDDEEEKAIACYRLLKRMKSQIPEIRERVVSICFSDSRQYPILQAADLFAYIIRLEAQKRFFGKEY